MFARLAALFFPDQCVICGQIMSFCKDEICICRPCAKNLPFLDRLTTCRRCGRPVSNEECFCDTCQTHTHYFDRAVSCLLYERGARSAVLRYKFGGRRDYCRTFSAMLCHLTADLHQKTGFDLVVYAPLSKNSYRERGYNQAELLAKRVAKRLHIPLLRGAFHKIRETQKQSTLHYADRMRNVERAFGLSVTKDTLQGKNILLIDDVLTTGATADALSRLLKRAGAKTVTVATIASTEKNRLDKISASDMEAVTF